MKYIVGNACLTVTCASLAAIPFRLMAMITYLWEGAGPCANASDVLRSVVLSQLSHGTAVTRWSMQFVNVSDTYAVWAYMLLFRLGDVNKSYLNHDFPEPARHTEQ